MKINEILNVNLVREESHTDSNTEKINKMMLFINESKCKKEATEAYHHMQGELHKIGMVHEPDGFHMLPNIVCTYCLHPNPPWLWNEKLNTVVCESCEQTFSITVSCCKP